MTEKRAFDAGAGAGDGDGDGDEFRREPKRPRPPALANVIVEALKVDSLQRLFSSMEPILRRIVSEEVERALVRIGPSTIAGRSSPKRIEGPNGRNLQLQFRTRLSLPLYTGARVEGEQGAAIHAILLDGATGCVVSAGPESSAKLDIVVLEGDFNNEDDEGWTEEEFENHIVKEREGKRPLLTGDLQITLKEGVGTIGEFTFTDNSSWIRSRKFRLGLKIASGFCEGMAIREAKTEAFTVKDHRGELYKKHYPPALKDDVWRLEKIGKGGSFHKRLNKSGIHTVEDFLRLVVRDPQKLRSILGSGMSNKMWESLVEHSKTCMLSGKYYVYYSDATQSTGAIFNDIYSFCGLISGGQFYSAESLNDNQKLFADTLVKAAYNNWMHVIEYDGRALLNSKQKKKTSTSQTDAPAVSANYSAPHDQQFTSNASAMVPLEQPSNSAGVPDGGYNGNSEYSYQHNVSANSHVPLDSGPFVSHTMLVGPTPQAHVTNNSTGLGLDPLQQVISDSNHTDQSIKSGNLSYFDDWSNQRAIQYDDFPEEEIRMQSHQMLENEDMQQLLRVFSMGGTSMALPEDGYSLPSYMPSQSSNFDFAKDHSRSSGKAVVGWLKIKAAMRWGIFVRKKAAERRRAQLIELDD